MKSCSLFAVLLTALVAVACGSGGEAPGSGSGDGSTGSGAAPAKLRVSVTDAPFPSAFVESASVVIREVRVRAESTESETEGEAEGGWTTVFTGSSTIDLVPLTGGVEALLVEAEIPAGTYSEARLIVDAGEVVLSQDATVADGEYTFSTDNGNLRFPSGAQTGIKVKIDNDIVVTSSLTAALVLDFDLSKSFVFNGPVNHAPGVKRVLFKPVVRASNASTGGTLSLDVMSDQATPGDAADDTPLAGATVRVLDDTDTEIAMGLTDEQGHFQSIVPAGTYALSVEAAGHDTATVPDVVVALANATDAGTATLAASAAEIVGAVLSDGGTAADASDDTNIEGATVEARRTGETTVVATATTDENGAYVLPMLDPGDYDLTVTRAGWLDGAETAITAAFPGTAVGVTTTLEALTQDVTGTVTDAATANVVGASVTVKNANDQTIAGPATTDDNGVYALAGVPSGVHTLEVDDAGTITTVTLTVIGTDPVSSQTLDVSVP